MVGQSKGINGVLAGFKMYGVVNLDFHKRFVEWMIYSVGL